MWIAEFTLAMVTAPGYANYRSAAHAAGRGPVVVCDHAAGIGPGVTAAASLREGTQRAVLRLRPGLVIVHAPALLILFFKRERGEGASAHGRVVKSACRCYYPPYNT